MNNLRLLCLIEGYSSLSEANAICLNHIVECWEKDGLSIDIVSIEKEKCKNKKGVINCTISSYGKIRKLKRKISKLIWMPIGRPEVIDVYQRNILRLISNNEYDAIIAIVNPIEAAEALKRVKRKYSNIKTILYEIDPSSNRYKTPETILQKIWCYRSKIWERRIYRTVDFIIHMETHKEHFSKQFYKEFQSKTVYLDIPSFEVQKWEQVYRINKNCLSFIYAGAFYPKLRNPSRMIELLKKLSEKTNIIVKIYTNSKGINIQRMIGNNSFIKIYSYIPQEMLTEEIKKSDILLDLGNHNSDFLASKTIQYISSGKPIIHFYSSSDDVSNKYYKSYDNCLLVDQRKNDQIILSEMIQFLDKLPLEIYPDYIYLKKKYIRNTPDYSAQRIMELVMK